MDGKIINSTLRGQCVCCGKRPPECKNWEECFERRIMRIRGFHFCALCGDGFGEREKQQHAGACLARYQRRVDELREAQAGDRLVTSSEVAGAAKSRSGPPPPCAARYQSATLGDLPPSLAWMYPRIGAPSAGKKPLDSTSRRLRPVTVTVKDKGVQAQEKLKDKATQTSVIELVPGQDVAYVRWTGLVQTSRPLLETDRARIYALMDNLRRAVADVLGGQEPGVPASGDVGKEERGLVAGIGGSGDAAALPNVYVDDAFASAEQQLDEIDEILRIRTGALERAMRGPSPSSGSDDLADFESVDGSMTVSVGSPQGTSSVACGETDGEEERTDSESPEPTDEEPEGPDSESTDEGTKEPDSGSTGEDTSETTSTEASAGTDSDPEYVHDGE